MDCYIKSDILPSNTFVTNCAPYLGMTNVFTHDISNHHYTVITNKISFNNMILCFSLCYA